MEVNCRLEKFYCLRTRCVKATSSPQRNVIHEAMAIRAPLFPRYPLVFNERMTITYNFDKLYISTQYRYQFFSINLYLI